MNPPLTQAYALRRGATFAFCFIAAPILIIMPALAAQGAHAEPAEVIFLVQLVLLMLTGRLLGEAMTRVGQPSVMGMLLAGMLLGPSVLGALWPELQQAIFPKRPCSTASPNSAFFFSYCSPEWKSTCGW
jgi:hypothetical protein